MHMHTAEWYESRNIFTSNNCTCAVYNETECEVFIDHYCMYLCAAMKPLIHVS